MKAKSQIEIRWELHEITIIRFRQDQNMVYCPWCERFTPHLSLEETVSVLSISEAEIIRLAENNQIHLNETPDRLLLLCSISMADL